MSADKRRFIWVALFGAVALQAQRGAVPSGPIDPAAAERGKALFSAQCAFCHGSQGTGSEQAPSLVRNYFVGQDRGGEVLGPIIRSGRPTQGMPAFPSLDAGQIADLVAVLHQRNNQGRDNGLPESALLVGDAKAGEAYFNSAGKCGTCHSAAGDLKGIGAKYTPLPLTIAFLTPLTTKPVTVKVVLSSGESVSGTLRDMDEFVLALDDANGEYRSWNRKVVQSVEVNDPLAPHRAMLMRYSDADIHNLLAYLVTLK